MKQEDWRKAYMPPQKLEASVKAALARLEETPRPRSHLLRAAVVAAAILIALCGAAYAAMQLGWFQYFAEKWNVKIPSAAQNTMNEAGHEVYQVGPLAITCQQLMADRHIALCSAQAQMADGSQALFASDTNIEDVMDDGKETLADLYGVARGTTWLEAARQTGLPLYGVRVLLEPAGEYDGGTAMEDAMWQEDGSIVSFSMPFLECRQAGEALPCTLYMAVIQFDTESGEQLTKWEQRETLWLPVASLLDEKDYQSQDGASLEKFTLQKVHAELYATGVYVELTVSAAASARPSAENLFAIACYDEYGKELPMGMSLSSSWNTDNWPIAMLEYMYSLEKLPARLLIKDGSKSVYVK